MKNPLVSLIMPLYNHEKYIKKSINTILNQSYKKIELIIIDDGSTDKSAEIVKNFKDKRIKYFYQKNRGVKELNKTINKGFKLSSGSLITMVTSDDFWPKNRLKKQIGFFKNDNIDLVFGNMAIVDENGKLITYKKPDIPDNFNSLEKKIKIKNYFYTNYIPQPTTLIRAKALKKINGYIQKKYMYAEDYPTQLNLMMNGEILYIDQNFSYYRLHENQMTNLHLEKMVLSDIRYLNEYYRSLSLKKRINTGINNFNELKRILDTKLKQTYLYIGFKLCLLKNYQKGKIYLFKAFYYGNFFTKLKSTIILFFVFLNIDLNYLKKLRRNFFY